MAHGPRDCRQNNKEQSWVLCPVLNFIVIKDQYEGFQKDEIFFLKCMRMLIDSMVTWSGPNKVCGR